MKISDDQIMKSLAYLRAHPFGARRRTTRSSERVATEMYVPYVTKLPNVRRELVGHLRQDVTSGHYAVSPDHVAEKMIGRAISDMLR